MTSVFTGTFVRRFDVKNRVRLPSEMRDILDAEDRKGMYLRAERLCISIWPRALLQTIAAGNTDPVANTSFNRLFYSSLHFRGFDAAGRVLVPTDLMRQLPNGQVLFVGVGDHIELWSPERFAQETADSIV
ncbi:MAG: hypothetical protein V3T86_02940 [Planctomycetota bacterium]